MDRDAILNEIDRLLWQHFPDDKASNAPYWHQRPYYDDLFNLAVKAYGIVSGDELSNYVRTHWNIRRQGHLTSGDEDQLEKLIDAWGEWQFAYRRLVADG